MYVAIRQHRNTRKCFGAQRQGVALSVNWIPWSVEPEAAGEGGVGGLRFL